MRRTIATVTFAACLAAGGVAGAALGAPGLSGAAEPAAGAIGWVQEALSGLVDEGTITQDQADAVESALREARPAHRHGHEIGGWGHGVGLATAAEQLGMAEEDLRAALREGSTIAQLAAEEGIDVEVVVEAVVSAHRERIAERVAAGDLTQERADEVLANLEERVTAFVDGEHPGWSGVGRGGPGGPGRHGGPPQEPAEDAS